MNRPPIVAIDLDNTLCDPIDRSDNIRQCFNRKPKEHMVKLVRQLKEKGFKIIIFTHRNHITRYATEYWLMKHNIPFDELILNKPKYDLLIDDKAYPPYRFLTADVIDDLITKISRWDYEKGSYRTNNQEDQS